MSCTAHTLSYTTGEESFQDPSEIGSFSHLITKVDIAFHFLFKKSLSTLVKKIFEENLKKILVRDRFTVLGFKIAVSSFVTSEALALLQVAAKSMQLQGL